MERNLRRLKNVPYPSMPKTPAEIRNAFKDPLTIVEFGYNLRDTHPFYINTVEINSSSAFTLFASHQVISIIEQNIQDRNFLMDGTFAVTPMGDYYQLLVIYIEYCNDVSFSMEKLFAF